MRDFLDTASLQNNPIRVLLDFLAQEKAFETAKQYEQQRFIGYALNISYDDVTMITSDPYKVIVGGIPRNSFLIMVPEIFDSIPPHFTLLRVLHTTETPLSRDVQQTYFELQKRSMPELDVFTQSELQWSALKVEVLGMFYPGEEPNTLEFSADLNNYLSAHKYRLYAPNDQLLDLIVNSMVAQPNRFQIGQLRLTENKLRRSNQPAPDVPVYVTTIDLLGTRTALFGKTRLGKSNTIKLIVQSIIETTRESKNVGQLIFDVNGEYANENPQNRAIPTVFPDDCVVYAITQKDNTPSRPLRLNFYEFPDRSHQVLGQLLSNDRRATATYVRNFIAVNVPSIEEANSLPNRGDRRRAHRKVLMYWAILHKAGFNVHQLNLLRNSSLSLNPSFNQNLRNHLYDGNPPDPVSDLEHLVTEMERLASHVRRVGINHESLVSTGSGNPLFDSDDEALLNFLNPRAGAGPGYLQAYRMYHDSNAGDFVDEILSHLNQGMTVILDLGNAHPFLLEYYSQYLSKAIFAQQVDRFSNNDLGDRYIQLYFEEAHNLFPNTASTEVDIYRRLAKEGAKYQIGMIYSTQSVSTIHPDLLAQTENFFVAHMSSEYEANALAKVNVEFANCKQDILRLKQQGFVRMLTRSHRFVIPVQIRLFE